VIGGTLLAVDPGSNSLGWAWYSKGTLIESGEYKAVGSLRPHKRLVQIMDQLAVWISPDVLAIEKMFRHNPSLIWSVGAAIVTTKPESMIEVPVKIWQDFIEDDYHKSDEADACLIGKAVLHYANRSRELHTN
jgi:hypothetical protein